MLSPNFASRFTIGALLLSALAPLRSLPAQDAAVQVDGLVLERKKYSFTLRGSDRDYRVEVPNGTPLLMKLTMPEIDFSARQLSIEILLSAPDGDPRQNTRIGRPVPDPLYLSAEFEDQASRAQLLKQGVHRLQTYVLSPRPAPPEALAIQGELRPSDQPGQYELQTAERAIQVQLGPRRGLMANASLMDLHPHATEVFVDGRLEGDALVASRIRFQPVGDPFARFTPGLPNVLVIGDQTSLNYDRALRETLAGKANLHHPPCNCGGSENWRSLHRWLANPEGAGRRWDVIAFNFGLHDQATSPEDYTDNLRRAIGILKSTGARLVWITTIPEPRGIATSATSQAPEQAPGRTKLQNEWAAAVLKDNPEVLVCDLWQTVTANPTGVFDEWWAGADWSFKYRESVPLAEAVADSILQAASGSATEPAPSK